MGADRHSADELFVAAALECSSIARSLTTATLITDRLDTESDDEREKIAPALTALRAELDRACSSLKRLRGGLRVDRSVTAPASLDAALTNAAELAGESFRTSEVTVRLPVSLGTDRKVEFAPGKLTGVLARALEVCAERTVCGGYTTVEVAPGAASTVVSMRFGPCKGSLEGQFPLGGRGFSEHRVLLESGALVALRSEGAEGTLSFSFSKSTEAVEPSALHALVLEDDPLLSETIGSVLSQYGASYYCVPTLNDAETIASTAFEDGLHLIFADYQLPDGLSLDYVRRLQEEHTGVYTVICSGYPVPPQALDELKNTDFVEKPFGRETIVKALNKAALSSQRETS